MDATTGLIVYQTTGGVDAIEEHSRRLARSLCEAGVPASYVGGGLSEARRAHEGPGWILLQYNPFSYGRRGVAPRLLLDAIALQRRTGRRFAVMVHEPWIEVRDWRSGLMHLYQRAQLGILLRLADTLLATTEALAGAVGGGAVHVPVGSNITPVAVTRQAARAELGFGDELVVTLFGTRHPSRALSYAERAVRSLAAVHGLAGVRVLNLGDGAPSLDIPPAIDVQSPGRLDSEGLSLRLFASDLVLLPFTDGVSTRRTTLMAALAHGVPVLGLSAPHSDRVLVDHPEAIALTPVGHPDDFARRAVSLAADPAGLRSAGAAGRQLYLSEFDWPVIARRVIAALRV